MWKFIKKCLWPVSSIVVIVFYLNVEKLAEARGWDTFLTDAFGEYFPEVYTFLAGQTALMLAFVLGAFTLGVWLDTVFRKIGPASSPDMAQLRISAERVSFDLLDALKEDRKMSLSTEQETKALYSQLHAAGLKTPKLDKFEGKTKLLLNARFLTSIIPFLQNDLAKVAKSESRKICKANEEILDQFKKTFLQEQENQDIEK